MRMRIRTYCIKSGEEAMCSCGEPLDHGDVAYEIVTGDTSVIESGFCSLFCANRAMKKLSK
jgi:hypothetical protein